MWLSVEGRDWKDRSNRNDSFVEVRWRSIKRWLVIPGGTNVQQTTYQKKENGHQVINPSTTNSSKAKQQRCQANRKANSRVEREIWMESEVRGMELKVPSCVRKKKRKKKKRSDFPPIILTVVISFGSDANRIHPKKRMSLEGTLYA